MKLASFKEIVSTLNGAEVRYLVAGGLAVAAHGYGRLTYGVDLVISLEADNVVKAFQSLESLGYQPRVPVTGEQLADASLRREWIEQKGMRVLNLFSDVHRETPVDVFVYEPFDFDDAYAGAVAEDLEDGITVRFVDIQTLISMKEGTGRAKDRDDVEQLRKIAEDEEQ
jgi:hypothetical protein